MAFYWGGSWSTMSDILGSLQNQLWTKILFSPLTKEILPVSLNGFINDTQSLTPSVHSIMKQSSICRNSNLTAERTAKWFSNLPPLLPSPIEWTGGEIRRAEGAQKNGVHINWLHLIRGERQDVREWDGKWKGDWNVCIDEKEQENDVRFLSPPVRMISWHDADRETACLWLCRL